MIKSLTKKVLVADILFIGVCTTLAIFVHGYSFGLGDQMLHIPLLNKIIDPTLFSKDYLFPLLFSHRTLVYDLILIVAKLFQSNLETVYFIFYFISTYFWYVGIYFLTITLFSNRATALISPLFFVLPYPIGGAAITTIETSFMLRLVTNTLVLYALIALLRSRWRRATILLGLVLLVHPLSGIVFSLLLIPAAFLAQKHRRFFFLLETAIIIGLLTVWPLTLYGERFPELPPFFVRSDWLETLNLRTAYAFPLQWLPLSWIYLFISLIPLSFYVFKQMKSKSQNGKRVFMLRILIISILFLLFQITFTSLVPVSYVVSMQLGRIWFIPVVLSFICGAYYLSTVVSKVSLFQLKIVLIMVMGLLAFWYKKPAFSQEPRWIEVQAWVKNHTSPQCTVLVDFYSQGFRVYSNRAILGEYKDGTLSFYSPTFAHEWDERKRRIGEINFSQRESLEELQQRYPFSLVVLFRDQKVPLNPIFQNENYLVYQMPQSEVECIIRL